MHEAGIIQSALRLAEERARAADATAIRRVVLRVGRMTGVVPEALEHAYAVLREGTLAAGAELHVEYAPGLCWCADCDRDFETTELIGECPRCGRPSGFVRGGTDIELVSLEVD